MPKMVVNLSEREEREEEPADGKAENITQACRDHPAKVAAVGEVCEVGTDPRK